MSYIHSASHNFSSVLLSRAPRRWMPKQIYDLHLTARQQQTFFFSYFSSSFVLADFIYFFFMVTNSSKQDFYGDLGK